MELIAVIMKAPCCWKNPRPPPWLSPFLWRESRRAPVTAGDQLGTLTVTAGEQVVAEIPILAGEDRAPHHLLARCFPAAADRFLAG